MAVKTKVGANTSEENVGMGREQAGRSLGFFPLNNKLINGNNTDASTVELAKQLKTVIAQTNDENVNIHVFTRSNYPALTYSNIVVTLLKNKDLFYYDILLEGTNPHDTSVSTLVESIKTNKPAFIASDAINEELHRIVLSVINKTGDLNVHNMDGIIIPTGTEFNETVVNDIAANAYNTLAMAAMLNSNEISDLNISRAMAQTNGYLALKDYSLTAPHIDALGKEKKVNWGVELTAYTKGNNNVPNTLEGASHISTVKGYINYIPEDKQIQVPGMLPTTKTMFHPQLILNVFDVVVPSLGYVLMSLATSVVLAKDDNWIKPVIDTLQNTDIGVLNKVANINNVIDKAPGAIKVASLNKLEDKVAAIKKLVPLEPILCMDISAFSDNSVLLSPIAAAAEGSQEAVDYINKTAMMLCNGKFESVNRSEMFAMSPIVIPEGEWVNNKGVQKTFDDIDTPYILSVGGTAAQKLAVDYISTELGKSPNPFVDRLELINNLGINGKVTGKKMRVTFSNIFLNNLLNGLIASGFVPRFESSEIINKPTGFGFTANTFSSATMSDIAAFPTYGTGNQNNFGYGFNGFNQTGSF